MTVTLIGMICALSMLPGSSTTVILDTTWSYGRRLGFVCALGGSLGVALYTVLAAGAGIYLTGGLWINILEGAGALYLAALGVMALFEAYSLRANAEHTDTSIQGMRALSAGFLATCLSPKTALFYLVILAQYDFGSISLITGILLTGTIHICFRMLWYGMWIHLIHPIRHALGSLWMQRAMKLTTAALMLGLSLHVVL